MEHKIQINNIEDRIKKAWLENASEPHGRDSIPVHSQFSDGYVACFSEYAAHAAKHAEELSKSETSAAQWMSQAQSIDQERNSLEVAIKAQRERHAGEVAKKDAEISEKNRQLNTFREQIREWDKSLTAAREREERLVCALKACKLELAFVVKDEACDHAVGICWCDTIRALNLADEVLSLGDANRAATEEGV